MAELSTWHWLGVALGAVAFLKLLKPVLYFNALLKSQYRRPTYVLVGPDEVQADVREYLEQASGAALALGFTPFAWVREQAFERSEYSVNHWLVLERACGAYAWIGTGVLGKGYRVEFKAELENGFRLLTYHGESKLQVASYPGAELVDTTSPDVSSLWARFAARLDQLSQGRPAVRRHPEAMIAAHQQWFDRAIDSWIAQRVLQHGRDPDGLELSAWQALRWAWQLNQHMPALYKFQNERAKLQPLDTPLSEEIRFFYRTRESMERRNTRWGWPATLLLSAVLFALSMAFQLDPTTLGMLVLVVLIHELGHYLAMLAFGYRNTSIFFIPFFGAAARGVKRDARLHEEIIVLLAGPLPGIALAVGLRALAPGLLEDAATRTFVEMLVVVNLANLLPLTPLDGGRVVQLAISNPKPWFEVGFRLLGALAILALGIVGSSGATIGLSLLLFATLPSARRIALAERSVRARGPLPAQEEQRLELLFGDLRAHQPNLPPAQRYAVVLPIVERLKHARPTALRALGWSATYVGCLAAGVLALPYIMKRPSARSAPAEPLACQGLDSLRTQPQQSGTFSLRCNAIAPERAAVARAELARFAALPMNGCLRAPWLAAVDPAARLTPAENRARDAVVAVARWRREGLRRRPSRNAASVAVGSIEQGADTKAWRARALAETWQTVNTRIQAHEHDASFDADAARMYVALFSSSLEPGEQGRSWARLLQKLGRNGTPCAIDEPGEGTSFAERGSGFAVSGQSAALGERVAEVAEYLCTHGCQLDYVTHADLSVD